MSSRSDSLTPKQEKIIETLLPEDRKFINDIVSEYGGKPFTITFSLSTVILAKQSMLRLFFLVELDYEILKLKELPEGLEVTLEFKKYL